MRRFTTCRRCLKTKWCDPHHVYRKRNSDETIWLCIGLKGCHRWVEDNVGEAKKLGFIKDGISKPIRKKMKKFKTPDFSKKKKPFKMPKTKDKSLKKLEGMKPNKKKKKRRSKFRPF